MEKKNQSIHFRLYTAFNCPISLGSFSQKCFFNLSLTFMILILLKTQLIILWNILQFGYVCVWQEYHQCDAVFKWQFWFVLLLMMFSLITWLKSCLPGFSTMNNSKMKLLFFFHLELTSINFLKRYFRSE